MLRVARIMKCLTSSKAAALDAELMAPAGGFSIDQLMELAGLSVAQAVYKYDKSLAQGKQVLVLVGPGNNGGDGLVAARHLCHLGAKPVVYYPKRTDRPLFNGLVTQLQNLDIKFLDHVNKSTFDSSAHVIDSLFGFSFKPPIREPFPKVIELLKETKTPTTSVDIPSSWDVDRGPLDDNAFQPSSLVSLTAPKGASRHLLPSTRHFLGGRFVSKHIADKYDLEVPAYEGLDHIVELTQNHKDAQI
ncbi:NAD(P)H-hydrate epimerase [Yarrowia sp. B02]|nr:NAD(P)H-hydrate epimerase [Yarrowia sp. B02]